MGSDRRRPYDPQTTYGQSKTANALFAVEAARRRAGDGITVIPGVVRTNLMRHIDPEVLARFQESGAADYALDADQAARLWEVSVTSLASRKHGPDLRGKGDS
ncbi:hypothetical protein AB0L53_57790 [Nonomuraea sp. NPDC052129]|uniref:hypothetical protein n=1 Tax=Nonomuraea sp. NPDC052129 TaxID=3154651 RepID=UPI0034404AE8